MNYIVKWETLGPCNHAIGDKTYRPVKGTVISIERDEHGAGGVGTNNIGILVDQRERHGKSPDEIDDPIRVVTMDFEGQKCTWDNIKGLQDELELWWDEGEDGEVTVTFHTMSEAAYKALPEFMGW